MTSVQSFIKYLAIAFAVFLTVSILSAAFWGLRVLAFFGELTSDDVGEKKTYRLEDVSSLDLELAAADLVVKRGETFSLTTDLKSLSVKESGGALHVKDTRSLIRKPSGSVTLLIPEDAVLELVRLEAGAGKVQLSDFAVSRLEIELGAGKATLSRLTAENSAEISGGAGKLTVADSSFTDLDLEMGAGKLDLHAALPGNSKIELGVGKAALTLLGEREEYRLRVQKGLGKVAVEGKGVSDGDVIGSGEYRVDLQSGVGSVRVEFEDRDL